LLFGHSSESRSCYTFRSWATVRPTIRSRAADPETHRVHQWFPRWLHGGSHDSENSDGHQFCRNMRPQQQQHKLTSKLTKDELSAVSGAINVTRFLSTWRRDGGELSISAVNISTEMKHRHRDDKQHSLAMQSFDGWSSNVYIVLCCFLIFFLVNIFMDNCWNVLNVPYLIFSCWACQDVSCQLWSVYDSRRIMNFFKRPNLLT